MNVEPRFKVGAIVYRKASPGVPFKVLALLPRTSTGEVVYRAEFAVKPGGDYLLWEKDVYLLDAKTHEPVFQPEREEA